MAGQPIPERYNSLPENEVLERIARLKKDLRDSITVLGHHYQRDEIIQFADFTGDSYKLSKTASEQKASYILFCGVHFMAESADILTRDDQIVILPDLEAGCSMADMAVLEQVEWAWSALEKYFGREGVMPITYMNSAADIKAFCGKRGGAVCTSSNAQALMEWGFSQREKVLFLPDQHLGRNTAKRMGISLSQMVIWDPNEELGGNSLEDLRRAKVILWKGHCSVHGMFRPEHVDLFRKRHLGVQVLVHPECVMEVVDQADSVGSTEFIIKTVEQAPAGSKWVIGTELHLVNRLKKNHPDQEIYFLSPTVCVCSTMFRIDPRHLLWVLENLAQGKVVNRIQVPKEVKQWARVALERMLQTTTTSQKRLAA
ncbi:MAG: quinolinate synthase NadA [Deltaproteobacteria bacterium]|nr:quinolinate synthase NadA [Deltaproteobacteria bacterium]